MDQNPPLDVLREKILIHDAVWQGASDNIGDYGDQEYAAGLLFCYWELKDVLNETIQGKLF